MELSQLDFLEEVVAPRIESWNNNTFTNAWNIVSPTFYQENQEFIASNSNSLLGLMMSPSQSNYFPCHDFQEYSSYPFLDSSFTSTTPTLQVIDSSTYNNNNNTSNIQERNMVEEGEIGHFTCDFYGHYQNIKMEEGNNSRIVEEKKIRSNYKVKKLEGQPSKNLMAERRRRKRLNDRLSMLRSVVPKISKMDRTSILGDTIDYVKELLDKINRLREEHEMENEIKDLNFMGNFKELKPNEAFVRNPPKFEVERRNEETSIEICCGTKPGLLLSTVHAMEALGLEVQQCVVSCFSDFSMRASCSEAMEHRTILSSEDVKQALFKAAGYGGRCL